VDVGEADEAPLALDEPEEEEIISLKLIR